MLTTQVQVLLYVGNIQIVSCSVFIPVPAIVVKSHQTLEAIRPYLPLSLTSLSMADAAVVAPLPAIEPPLDDPLSSSSSSSLLPTSTSLILSPSSSSPTTASSPTSTPVPSCSSPTCSHKGHRHTSSSSSLSHSHSQAHSTALTISPDSSIPATTCIKISLRPTPSFKLVNPKCPHQQQRNRNLRHLKQQQQQQELYLQQQQQLQQEQELQEQQQQQRQQRQKSSTSPPPTPQLSSPPSGHRSHSHSNSHSRSQSPSAHPRSHHSSHRSSHRRHSHRCTHSNMTSLSARPQTSVLFTYPHAASSSSSSSPKIVQVTGSFNDWQRTDPLTLNQALDRFELEVAVYLKEGSEEKQKILFKFVLDDQEWVTDASQERERDQAGNLNNILLLDPAKATVANSNNNSTDTNEEPAVTEVDSTQKTEVAAFTVTEAERTESEEERLARLKQEEEDDATIRQLGGGMWGAPFFTVNDPANLPEHFVDSAAPVATDESEEQEQDKHEDEEKVLPSTPAQQPVVQKTEPIVVAVEQPTVAASDPVAAAVVPAPAAQEEEEDEDDATIRRLGGGMWGTPFFKVNDPTVLPEHFVEALGAPSVTANTTPASSSAEPQEVITDREEEVIRDDISGTMEGTLIETVVETTEDIVVEDAQGNFLEESITTSRQESIEGEVQENVTEVIETIEEIEPADPIVSTPPTPTPTSSAVAVATEAEAAEGSTKSDPHVTMTETEVISVGADGVETTVLEETITFVEGPEVDSSSLHSLTTAIKPVQDGESVLVEAVPELHVQTPPTEAISPPSHPTPLAASAGDAKPSVDVSTITTSANSTASASNVSPSSTARTSVHGDHYEGDGDYGVVYLQGQQPVPSGDATPAADMSVDVAAQELPSLKPAVPSKSKTTAAPAATTTTSTEKTEKRKSFWKKLKKVLT